MKAVFENKEQEILVKQIKGFLDFSSAYHDHIEMILVLEGSIYASIGGKDHVLKPGQMSICFPYQIHSYEKAPDAQVLLALFPSRAAGMFTETVLKMRPQDPYIQPAPHIVTLLQRLLVQSNQTGAQAKALTNVYISAIVGELLQQMPMEPVGEMDTNAIQKLLSYCQNHYRENISVASASQAVHISERYITKIFSTQQGCVFRKYINRLRIMDVKRLLQETDRTVTDIMLTCGFNNQSTFNRVFYEQTGMSPREYRKQGKEKAQKSAAVFMETLF